MEKKTTCTRRDFIKLNTLTGAGMMLTFGGATSLLAKSGKIRSDDHQEITEKRERVADDAIIDTNIHLFDFPFRNFKYRHTRSIIQKLKHHHIEQAWAGSFEALFHKNIDHVNSKLAKECQSYGDGMLLPFGTVNPIYIDWEEDLRRCHEEYQMPGIRLYPGYHGYTLESEQISKLIRQAAQRGIFIQIVIDIQDERLQHPLAGVPAVDITPLRDTLKTLPEAKVQVINPFRHVRREKLRMLIDDTNVLFDISNLDGTAALDLIISGNHWYEPGSKISADRLLFGSHMPFFPLENALFKFMESSSLTAAQIKSIRRDNAIHALTGA